MTASLVLTGVYRWWSLAVCPACCQPCSHRWSPWLPALFSPVITVTASLVLTGNHRDCQPCSHRWSPWLPALFSPVITVTASLVLTGNHRDCQPCSHRWSPWLPALFSPVITVTASLVLTGEHRDCQPCSHRWAPWLPALFSLVSTVTASLVLTGEHRDCQPCSHWGSPLVEPCSMSSMLPALFSLGITVGGALLYVQHAASLVLTGDHRWWSLALCPACCQPCSHWGSPLVEPCSMSSMPPALFSLGITVGGALLYVQHAASLVLTGDHRWWSLALCPACCQPCSHWGSPLVEPCSMSSMPPALFSLGITVSLLLLFRVGHQPFVCFLISVFRKR